jgi:hypothetical protein
MSTPNQIDPFGLPPEEAIQWFREKGFALTWDWRELWQGEHSSAFTVAKATQLDILADIRKAVDDAIANGSTLQAFKKGLKPLLQSKGWWGIKEQVDPQTGEVTEVQLGSPRRLKTIYDTNLRQSMSAGRWQTARRLKTNRPYLRYVHRFGSSPHANARPQHQRWHDLVRPVDDPSWEHIMPMNGWGCHCKVQQMNERDLARYGLKVSDAPDLPTRTWVNKLTGQTLQVTDGIDPGFDYNPGKAQRGFEPLGSLPVLRPVKTFSDMGRPNAADATRLPAAPPQLIARGTGSGAIVRSEFRKLFGVPDGMSEGRIADPQGCQVAFHTDLLRYIMRKPGRVPFLPHAKATVEDPFEVWMTPYRRTDGTVEMRKRYVGLFAGGERTLVVVEQNGAFNIYDKRGIDGQRQGYLLYAKGEQS